jgi:hypothetical protein
MTHAYFIPYSSPSPRRLPLRNCRKPPGFRTQQVTGVGVSQKSGRIFVNFPYWSDDHRLSVAEIVNGQPRAFPDEEWNKPGPPGTHFVCVQSVVVDDQNNFWLLDPAAPKLPETLKDGPKLVKVDLARDKVTADDSVR